jgi:hypothetical protein
VGAAPKTPPPPPGADRLEKLRRGVRLLRAKRRELENVEARAKTIRAEINDLEHVQLVDLMDEAGVDSVGLPAEGNEPAEDYELRPYYHAVLPRDPETDEPRQEGLDWLEKHRHGDLVKTIVTVRLGLGDRKLAKQVSAALKKLGVDYDERRSVPHQTLTAFVREQIEKYQRTPPLGLLGATVGRVVKVKQRKGSRSRAP